MSTILFNQIAFGPLHSRRLGISLGMNLMPGDGKLCSFDCIYCECGYNTDNKTKTKLPTRSQCKQALEQKLVELNIEGIILDVITFSGNGEPTLHPHFAAIIDDTIVLRNKYVPKAKISVLSNAMHIDRASVFRALSKVDNNILKIDSAILNTAQIIDRPTSSAYSIENQIILLKKFKGNFILQTMFLKGEHEGVPIDNTTDEEIDAWIEIIKEISPKEVMIYSLDRETPSKNLEKISFSKLSEIGLKVEQLGIKVSVAK